MNQQPQQKASNKRTGKRITFFNEQQGLPVTNKEPQIKEQQFYGPAARLPVSQASQFHKIESFTTSASNNMLNTVMYTQDRADSMRMNQQQVQGKWNLPERTEASWQAQPAGVWTRAPGYGVTMVSSYYNTHEPLKRSQDKAVGVSQLDMYGDALQQMMSQKAQLEQHTFARQQAHLNSILHAQQQQQQHQQQQQQQQQTQHMSLQPFQMAFGHQGKKPALSELFHAFPESQANAAFATQQKQQTSLPQMQLFENFYPSQQQQAAYSMQQPVSMSQPHRVGQQMHVMSQSQHAPTSQELMKTYAEQNQQPVLPKNQIPLPRRSRRLSKEGLPPLSSSEVNQTYNVGEGQANNPYMQHTYENAMRHQVEAQDHYKRGYHQLQRDAQMATQDSHSDRDKAPLPQNGRPREMQNVAEQSMVGSSEPAGAVTGGVIQTTRRRRRISQEANLLTLAQKAVELASLQNTKQDDSASVDKQNNQASKSNVDFVGPSSSKRSRGDDLRPLIMPVSVPVNMETRQDKREDRSVLGAALPERDSSKPSVIVTRHRAGQPSIPALSVQTNDTFQPSEGETPSRKPRQRPRPEPLFIPPKAGTFIVPVAYSNITPYQSHLRSPVRVPDHLCDRNFELPPYTPPPILSPVREGSGLYFNAIMSASGLSMPPPITPKSTTRTLLRSSSIEDMPPLLTAIGEATPVSIEPRINIGSRFQADIPDLRDRSLVVGDKHKADLVWWPWEDSGNSHGKVEELLIAACSSIMPGGGTNQELALHYLHESKGNILAALTKLLLKKPQRNRCHPLADYHYSGSDKWTVAEKKLFNKGMAIYKKDFLLVQKLIKTKTVAQCVEFYYTYKKQVKIGRNGVLIFGDIEVTADEKFPGEDAEVDIKSSHRLAPVIPPRREVLREDLPQVPVTVKEEDEEEEIKVQVNEEEKKEEKTLPFPSTKVTQTLQASETSNDILLLRSQEPNRNVTEKAPKPRGRRPRKKFPPDGIKKPEVLSKPQEQEGSFPCKKCGRVFGKVKSRSAHMKSHSEQEKKAAAQKQSEIAAAQAERAAYLRSQRRESTDSGSNSSDSSSSSSSSSESCDSSDDGEI